MNELIQRARELCEKATPGPWYNFGDWMIHTEPDIEHNGIPNEKTIGTVRANNASFIAVSRTLVPQLCDALEAAQTEIGRLIDLSGDWKEAADQYHAERNEATARAEKAEADAKRLKTKLMFSKARECAQELFPELTPKQKAENAEIVALTIRAEKAEKALGNMRFAYINKDPDVPHSFEEDALRETESIIGKWPTQEGE